MGADVGKCDSEEGSGTEEGRGGRSDDDVLESKTFVVEVLLEALLGDRAKGSSGQTNANPSVFVIEKDTLVLQIRKLSLLRSIVGVGNAVSNEWFLFRKFAFAGHGRLLVSTLLV